MLRASSRLIVDGLGPNLAAIARIVSPPARPTLEFLADHDPLTGLFNRRRFTRELSRQLEYARRYGGGGALAMLDLDHLKEINDASGHTAGDDALVKTAQLLRDRLRGTDLLARLGGDEFAVALPHTDRRQAKALLEDLLGAVRQHTGVILAPGRPLTVSVGMTLFGDDPKATGPDLLARADVAMYQAKAQGGDTCVAYDPAADTNGARDGRGGWSARIRDALQHDRLVLHTQPIIDLATGSTSQRETLLRMWDGDEMILPGAFLYTAERFGLARDLDRWVIHHALNDIPAQPGQALTINLSADSVTDAEIPEFIERELAACGRVQDRPRRLRRRLRLLLLPQVPPDRLPQDRRGVHPQPAREQNRPDHARGDRHHGPRTRTTGDRRARRGRRHRQHPPPTQRRPWPGLPFRSPRPRLRPTSVSKAL